ncbi:MAG TPA: ribosome biogenesis GTPase Der [bacterium]|nr:ribosome biogenesis GTPase Der [bacterium]
MRRVAIIGRPNVGKSTLFNRLIGERRAIVAPVAGVTRDRIYGTVQWRDREFMAIDTSGLDFRATDSMSALMRRQVELAAHESDAVIWVVDGRAGLLPDDEEVAVFLQRARKPFVVAVNKADGLPDGSEVEFYSLGVDCLYLVSAAHGTGTGELLDAVYALLPPEPQEPPYAGVKVAVVGRPNVGKSSLVNAIVGDERCLVSPEAGTTRDNVDTDIVWQGQPLRLIDTAGLRRAGSARDDVEYYSKLRAENAIERCDVAVLVLEATQPLADQDAHIGGMIFDRGCGCIIAVNKWDALVERSTDAAKELQRAIARDLQFLGHAPVVLLSAKKKHHTAQIPELAQQVHAAGQVRVPTAALNRLLFEVKSAFPPQSRAGRRASLRFLTQIGIAPPLFALQVNDPRLVHFSYKRYLTNRLREQYAFTGWPIRLVVRARDHEA